MYGHWERHVMAEAFCSRVLTSDRCEVGGYRLQVFDSLFGLALVVRQ